MVLATYINKIEFTGNLGVTGFTAICIVRPIPQIDNSRIGVFWGSFPEVISLTPSILCYNLTGQSEINIDLLRNMENW